MKELLEIAIPIIFSMLGVSLQQLYTYFKAMRYNLADHRIISDLQINIQHLTTWKVKQNRQVFVDALSIKFEIWLEETEKFVEEINNKHISRGKLKTMFIKWALNTIKLYNERWEQMGIPKIVRDHINREHQEKVDKFLNEIEIVIQDKTFPSVQYIKREILTILRLLLSETKDDFNTIVYRTKYNGEFAGAKYNSVPINDAEYTKYMNKNKL